ncbi:MAG: hypothetical protein ABR569_15400 [Gaiellaceae bacterium]
MRHEGLLRDITSLRGEYVHMHKYMDAINPDDWTSEAACRSRMVSRRPGLKYHHGNRWTISTPLPPSSL